MKMYPPHRFLLLLLSLSVLGLTASAQSYKRMMKDLSYNVYEVIDSAEAWFATHPRGKGSGWKQYQRWKYDNESMFYPSGDRSNFDPGKAWREHEAFMKTYGHRGGRSGNNIWTELGPWSANDVRAHWSAGLGRVEALWVNPTNTNQIYIGARLGGFWKTSDGGTTWTNSTDYISQVGVLSLAVSPHSPDTILIETAQSLLSNSSGVWKSYDGGNTWQTTPWNTGYSGWFTDIEKMMFHPQRTNELWIGTEDGLFMSTDHFNTWDTLIWGTEIQDFEFKPGDPNTVYAVTYPLFDSLLISTNAGASFQKVRASGVTWRTELAVTPADPNYLYYANGDSVWRSTNSGASFSARGESPDWFGCFGVSDTDKERVLFGGIDTHLSTDGGQNFSKVTFWSQPTNPTQYIHADLREVLSLNGTWYVGTDGYLGKSTNGGTVWSVHSDGTAIREFYRIGTSVSHAYILQGGSQDNGTSGLQDGQWYEWLGADGMECAVSNMDPNVVIGETQFGGLNISFNAGYNRSGIKPSTAGSGAWVTPFVLDPNHPEGIYYSTDRFYYSTDYGANWTDRHTWPWDLEDLAVAKTNSNLLYGSKDEHLWRSTDGGNNWTDVSNNSSTLDIWDIVLHPKQPDTLVIVNVSTYGWARVWRSYNGGSTWTDITYNLPPFQVLAGAIDDSGPTDRLYVGTNIGVYEMPLHGNTWNSYNHNLPYLQVREMEIHKGSNTLRAISWGRGLWEAPLIGRENSPRILVVETSPTVTQQRPTENQAMDIVANITDPNGTIASAWVQWSVNSTSHGNTLMLSPIGQDMFQSVGKIPAQNAGDIVHMLVFAVDNSGDTTCTDRLNYLVRPYNCSQSNVVASMSSNTNICQGDSTQINVNTGFADWYEIIWDNGLPGNQKTHWVSPTTTTTYNVTVVDSFGCAASGSVTISVGLQNVALTLSVGDSVCSNGGSVTLGGGSPAGGVYSGTGVSAGSFDPAVAGTGSHVITYTYTDVNGCFGTAQDSLTVVVCIGLESGDVMGSIVLYPNPSDAPAFRIALNLPDIRLDGGVRLRIFDLQGRRLMDQLRAWRSGDGPLQYDLDRAFAKGIYQVELIDEARGQRIWSGEWQYR